MSTSVRTDASKLMQRVPTVVSSAEKAGPTLYAPRKAKTYNPDDLQKYKVPDLSVQDLLSSIPSHCFQRSAFHSFLYLFVDFIQLGILVYGATWINTMAESVPWGMPGLSLGATQSVAKFALWSVYCILQGFVFTGIWVIAHECGHQAFSSSKTLNNAVGWVLHSALLVPYHSWRISHGRHHAGTGHLFRDEVFVPRTRDDRSMLPLRPADDENAKANESWGSWLGELLEDAPLFNFFELLLQQTFGWILYLTLNVSGQLSFPNWTNHFSPDSVIFNKRHRNQILMSDVGIALALGSLFAWGSLSPGGWREVVLYYGIPYMLTNHWLVMITYLQHTDPLIPHYSPDAWTFPRGALCTVDREWLGFVGPWFLHGISETHVLHHVSSKIPHYHAWEATEALKKRIGMHYMKSTENVFVSLWKTIRGCRYIELEDVAFYRNADGIPKSVALLPQKVDSGLSYSE
ncbi:hypothetical protein MVES1_000337 [Malassezia vespertilionis]|uniref:uncharacterized protein n=1 Tax=Malassezia vespertilionis TaxID=2020962 RepID=UPI0024B11342|nr:uncharacterized protein MVES1_000337 [Malassezia vespertilionis]WFD05012.1 hypothetical protein MVES1_000337 [Malassezia vespertilionis]